MSTSRERAGRKALEEVAVLATLGLLACAVTYPWALHLGDHLPMNLGAFYHDHWLSLWALWSTGPWAPRGGYLPAGGSELIFAPAGVRLPWLVQVAWGTAVAYPLQWLLPLVTVHNLLLLSFLTVAGYGTYRLALHLTGHRGGALCAGAAIVASPFFLIEVVYHYFLVAGTVWIPWFLLAMLRFWERPGPEAGLVLGGLLAASVASYWYFTAYLALCLALFAGWMAWRDAAAFRRPGMLRGFAAFAAVAAGAALLAAIPTIRQNLGTEELLATTLRQAREWSVDLGAYLRPTREVFFFGLGDVVGRVPTGFMGRVNIFLGYTLLALAGLAWTLGPRRALGLWTATGALFLLLSLGPDLALAPAAAGQAVVTLPLPYRALYALPIFNGLRDLHIFAVMVVISLAVLAGFGVAGLCRRFPRWPEPAVAGAVVGLMLLELTPVPGFPLWRLEPPAAYAAIARDPRPVSVLELPYKMEISVYQFYQTLHGKRILNGVLNRLPTFNRRFGDDIRAFRWLKAPLGGNLRDPSPPAAAEWEALARFFELGYVVLHRDTFLELEGRGELQPGSLRAVEAFLASVADRLPGEGGSPLYVYRLRPPGPARPGPVRVDFDGQGRQPVLLAGWSFLEDWQGLSVAWSLGRASVLWLPSPGPGPAELEFRVQGGPNPVPGDWRVRVAINDRNLGTVEVPVGAWRVHRMAVPAGLLDDGIARVRFGYPRVYRVPVWDAPDAPHRAIAVAFDYVELRPGAKANYE